MFTRTVKIAASAWAPAGCPFLGYISDRIGRRKPVMIAGALAMGLLTVFAIYVQPPMVVRYVVALALGISSGAAMIPFSMIKEANPPEVKGSAAEAMNFLCFGVTGVLSPFIARMLDPGPGRTERLPGFQHGPMTLAFGVAVALVLLFFLRETGGASAQQGVGPTEQAPSGEPKADLAPLLTLHPAPRSA